MCQWCVAKSSFAGLQAGRKLLLQDVCPFRDIESDSRSWTGSGLWAEPLSQLMLSVAFRHALLVTGQ